MVTGDPVLRPSEWHAQFLAELASEGFNQDGTPIQELLSAQAFLAATTGAGRLPLDPGADFKFYTSMDRAGWQQETLKHGALSHTLQWLIVKRSFSMARYLPDRLVDLFQRTGTILGRPQEKVHLSLWSTLVDLPPDKGVALNATMPEGITALVKISFPHIKALEDTIEGQYLQQLHALGTKVFNSEGKVVV